MKRLLILITVILCFVPLASATFNPSYGWLNNTAWDYLQPITYNNSSSAIKLALPTTNAECQNFCGARGLGSGDYPTFYFTTSNNQASYTNEFSTYETPYSSSRTNYPTEDDTYLRRYALFLCKCEVADPGGPYSYLKEISKVAFRKNDTDVPGLPNADFIGVPTTGPASLYVTYTDQSTNVSNSSAMTYNWSISPGSGWTSSSMAAKNLYANFNIPGNYTISHGISGTWGSDIETKTNYTVVTNGTTDYYTTHVAAYDYYSGYFITNAQIDILDVENASWTNTTTTNGQAEIRTLASHTLDMYATATGYNSDNLIGVPAVNEGWYSLRLTPANTTFNTTSGNLTLVVTALENSLPHSAIVGANIQVAYGPTTLYGTSNAAGVAYFTVPNNTAMACTVIKSGYQTATAMHLTGSANGGTTTESQIVYVSKNYVTATPTPTGTGVTPVTTSATIDPYPCDADHPQNCQRKQTDMANILIEYGPMLVLFFIALTIIGGVKQIGR